ncbi:hypothetical protein KFE94_07185 [bacterium SCSIO 12643]|nr:hypothetical protein KFE94_07185 [bacterium SCSIO 12643]
MKIKKSISLLIILILSFIVGSYLYDKAYHENIKKQPQMYCYESFFEAYNGVLIIESLEYKDYYLEYYFNTEKRISSEIKFPLKSVPLYNPVYVMGYSKDGLLADVVSYYDRGVRFGGSYTRGWVYAKTLHKDPPPKKESK